MNKDREVAIAPRFDPLVGVHYLFLCILTIRALVQPGVRKLPWDIMKHIAQYFLTVVVGKDGACAPLENLRSNWTLLVHCWPETILLNLVRFERNKPLLYWEPPRRLISALTEVYGNHDMWWIMQRRGFFMQEMVACLRSGNVDHARWVVRAMEILEDIWWSSRCRAMNFEVRHLDMALRKAQECDVCGNSSGMGSMRYPLPLPRPIGLGWYLSYEPW